MELLTVSRSSRIRSLGHRLSIRARANAEALQTRITHPTLGILGCYNTSNIGDIALGASVFRVTQKQGLSAATYSYGLLRKSRPPLVAVAGGGGILTTHPSSPLRVLAQYHQQCPVVALIGLSGKIESSELDTELRLFLENVPFISLRSKDDVDELRRLIGRDDINYYPDTAFALADAPEESRTSSPERQTLAINVCPQLMTLSGGRFRAQAEPSDWFRRHCADEVPFYSQIGPAYVQVMRDAVQCYLDRGWEVESVPFACEDDLFARFVFDGMAVRHRPYTISPQRVLSFIARCDAMIATRFHAHVFALSIGTPLLSVAYADKVVGLFADLDMPSSSSVRRVDIARDQAGALELLTTEEFVVLPEAERRHVVECATEGIEAGLTKATLVND